MWLEVISNKLEKFLDKPKMANSPDQKLPYDICVEITVAKLIITSVQNKSIPLNYCLVWLSLNKHLE